MFCGTLALCTKMNGYNINSLKIRNIRTYKHSNNGYSILNDTERFFLLRVICIVVISLDSWYHFQQGILIIVMEYFVNIYRHFGLVEESPWFKKHCALFFSTSCFKLVNFSKMSVEIYLDIALAISKAFHKVWHANLPHKMKSISGQIFDLI